MEDADNIIVSSYIMSKDEFYTFMKPKNTDLKKEDNKMNATSTENFHDIIAIDFELQTFPNPDVEDKFIVSATSRDDIFCFVFEGPDLLDTCRKTGLFSAFEKYMKIRELEEEVKQKNKEINELKQQLQKAERDKKNLTASYTFLDGVHNGLLKDFKQLKDKLDVERAANEAHHKFFRKYAGNGVEIDFNYAIEEVEEVSYVIVDKEKYESLKNTVKELEELKTPTIENFADEEHTDNVNHPSHYETGKYECIDVMIETQGVEAVKSFCKCNAFKYIYRANNKNGLEDIQKAIWYLNKYVELCNEEFNFTVQEEEDTNAKNN